MTKPAQLLGEGMTPEEWQAHLERMKLRFLAHNAALAGTPFPNVPKLQLPVSNVADLNYAGGETEGLL